MNCLCARARRCPVLALTVLALSVGRLDAQVKVLYVEPGQTDPAIATVHGPHLAVYDPQVIARTRLFFFIVGTGGNATNSLALDTVFARWGYHAVSLDYENKVITVACAHSLDPKCFDKYRDAIVTGAPGSDKVQVNPANSITNRFEKLLAYLVDHDPQGGWDQFMKDGKPVWSRIIVAGHSQGSGHAAYLGKMFLVDRVLMFSGPQDYFDDLHCPAPWLARESATPPDRFFAFLSQNDPFNVRHQTTNCMVLMHLAQPEIQTVMPQEPVQGNCRILINDVPQKAAHGSTVSLQYTNVWYYMLSKGIK